MWVLIDNYDSFTHILHHYLLETGAECRIVRNDELSVPEIISLNPSRIILSPGPGRPEGAGNMMEVIRHFHLRIPMLGICLGHQALGLFFGMNLSHAPAPVHGKTSVVRHTGHALFAGIPDELDVMRYHSLSLKGLPEGPLKVTARAVADGTIMAVQHRELPLTGLQFHPESVGTPQGKTLISNWARLY